MNHSVPAFIVLKFSGNAVSYPAAWKTIAERLQLCIQKGFLPLAVCSAAQGVTDMLDDLTQIAAGTTKRSASSRELQTYLQAPVAELQELHLNLAQSLGLNGHSLLDHYFEELDRWLLGLTLTGEVTPRLKARILGLGERMLSNLGAAWLDKQGIKVKLWDAASLLKSHTFSSLSKENAYLNATCQCEVSPRLQELFTTVPVQAHLVQGYIAGNEEGEQVLLGRGGSDLSAAYFGVMLDAAKVEFWTNVPGMYTADPRKIPTARLLRHLDYSEAQELASVGMHTIHPRSLPPLQQAGIPVEIRCLQKPNLEGTHISVLRDRRPRVKAVAVNSKVILISLEDIGMWQQVGFLADVFGIFAHHGLSVDLVATSQTNVTVSLDTSSYFIEPSELEALLNDLSNVCNAHLIAPCAALSLVGTKIRSNLHKLGPALELFEEEKVHLLSQAASDLNITFVIDENQSDRLLNLIHSQLFSGIPDPELFGPSWKEEFAKSSVTPKRGRPWWYAKRQELLDLAEATPAYVYDRETLCESAKQLLNLKSIDRIMFAMKANSNPEILKIFYNLGLGFECVSIWEVQLVKKLFPDLSSKRLIFTPNFASEADYLNGFEAGASVTLDNINALETWPETFRGRSVFLRLDLGHGAGHSRKVRTAGNFSKFGIPVYDLDKLKIHLKNLGITVRGLHSHSGSGIKTIDTWAENAQKLCDIAEQFPQVKTLDLGGGLGVPERQELDSLDLNGLDQQLLNFRNNHPDCEIIIEPGRFLVAQAGVIISKVTQIKNKGSKNFIGLDAGMNTLIRPALYGAYHEIRNLTRLDEPDNIIADVVGPICETGDILGRDRHLPSSQSGDVMLIATAGAYGFTMSSDYNLRPRAAEIFI